ncbi:hypothetical protein SAMN04488694_12628 [Natrinema hispanicum]|uniref:Uncharacterized protein n=1 Tax=Natrinema hispanicum TaxID=392421 RepID=A0A1I0IWL7_9EURY|nr:hypothetical protein SAMN04488694_12628 [Natrinema hispanicum]
MAFQVFHLRSKRRLDDLAGSVRCDLEDVVTLHRGGGGSVEQNNRFEIDVDTSDVKREVDQAFDEVDRRLFGLEDAFSR